MPIVKWYTVGDSGGEKSNFKYTDELNETEHFFCFAHNASAATVSCGYWYSRHRTVWFAYEFGLLTFECLLLFYSKAPVCAQTKRQHDQVFWGACAAIESSVHKLYLYLSKWSDIYADTWIFTFAHALVSFMKWVFVHLRWFAFLLLSLLLFATCDSYHVVFTQQHLL